MRSDVAERVGELLDALLDDRSGAPAAVRSVTPVTEGWSARHGVRLPKLLARDDPHPLGFSRRGQLLDTLQVAVDASAASGALRSARLVRADHRRTPAPVAGPAAEPGRVPGVPVT
ncbi:hypothetical protein [Saccharothrix sp. NRRL B-16314]|uniref:hypothetical protein n=1 Tax=Saccharothrix sp. NRRL B-16314 TaxID=1463825 RepID=UPI000526E320|nr:hypothetical protein [Saccharothrix sp. NRRL B-16314]